MIKGLRYLTDDLLALRRMTPSEFNLRMTANALKRADREEELAKQALYNRRANAHRKDGTYIITKYTELFDIEKVEKQLLVDKTKEEEQTFDRLREIARRQMEYQSRKEA